MMTLLIVNQSDTIVQSICGDEWLLAVNAERFATLGYRCMYVDHAPLLANKIVDGKPVRLEPVVDDKHKLMLIRQERDQLLSSSDWTQMPDSPLTSEKKAEWATYRQALRDFPETYDINNPIWPTPPQ